MGPQHHNLNSPFIIRKLDSNCYGANVPIHPMRSQVHYFFFLLKGTVLVDIGEKTYLIKPGEFAIVPVGEMFAVKYYDKSEGYMGGFASNYLEDDSSVGSGNLLKRFDFLRVWGYPVIEFTQETAQMVAALFDRIYRETLTAGKNEEIIKAYLTTILVEAHNLYKRENNPLLQQSGSVGNRFLELLFGGEQIKHTVAEYADILNVTPNHLNKMVKALTGKSPSVWIEEALMKEAKVLLRNTSLPLSEVAARIGIMDQSYFARRFKKHSGVSPRDYRAAISVK